MSRKVITGSRAPAGPTPAPSCSRWSTSRPTSAPSGARSAPSTACRSSWPRGRTLGVVGESGSGKTILSRSIMGLLPTPATSIREGHVYYEGTDIIGYTPGPDARGLGLGDGHGLPGPDDLAQPGHEDRSPDHRVARAPPRHGQERGQRDRPGPAPVGGHPRARAAPRRVPPPALGRHAPARHHRHRPGLRPQDPLRRRAHHRPRRDRAGPDPQPAAAASRASATWP